MSTAAANLAAICAAVRNHDASCASPANGVAMNPFEVERLGWDDIMGLPIEPDSALGTGRFRVLCDGEKAPSGATISTSTPTRVLEPVGRTLNAAQAGEPVQVELGRAA